MYSLFIPKFHIQWTSIYEDITLVPDEVYNPDDDVITPINMRYGVCNLTGAFRDIYTIRESDGSNYVHGHMHLNLINWYNRNANNDLIFHYIIHNASNLTLTAYRANWLILGW